jgi:hypothetical protein
MINNYSVGKKVCDNIGTIYFKDNYLFYLMNYKNYFNIKLDIADDCMTSLYESEDLFKAADIRFNFSGDYYSNNQKILK